VSAREAAKPHAAGDAATPFRFYDNRQKYLAFVNTCNEKSAVAHRAALELKHVRPMPPALRIFDAGMGDATVLARIMRHAHAQFPTVPLMVVAKEISLEDVRLGLEKMPDRFLEHPATVLVVTNLNYSEAPRLMPRDIHSAAALNWHEVRLKGHTSTEYAEQIEELAATLAIGWQTKPSARTGNPVYVRPSVLVVYREDHKFLLDRVIPNLPDDADRPTLRKFDLAAFPILILGASSDLNPIQFRRLIDDDVRYRIERVNGVASLDIWATRARA